MLLNVEQKKNAEDDGDVIDSSDNESSKKRMREDSSGTLLMLTKRKLDIFGTLSKQITFLLFIADDGRPSGYVTESDSNSENLDGKFL